MLVFAAADGPDTSGRSSSPFQKSSTIISTARRVQYGMVWAVDRCSMLSAEGLFRGQSAFRKGSLRNKLLGKSYSRCSAKSSGGRCAFGVDWMSCTHPAATSCLAFDSYTNQILQTRITPQPEFLIRGTTVRHSALWWYQRVLILCRPSHFCSSKIQTR